MRPADPRERAEYERAFYPGPEPRVLANIRRIRPQAELDKFEASATIARAMQGLPPEKTGKVPSERRSHGKSDREPPSPRASPKGDPDLGRPATTVPMSVGTEELPSPRTARSPRLAIPERTKGRRPMGGPTWNAPEERCRQERRCRLHEISRGDLISIRPPRAQGRE